MPDSRNDLKEGNYGVSHHKGELATLIRIMEGNAQTTVMNLSLLALFPVEEHTSRFT